MRNVFILGLVMAFSATVAPAQSAPTKIGVINIQAALVNTADGKKAAAELEAKRAPKTKELEKQQAEIRSLQDQLNRGGNAMSEQAKQELMRNIDDKTKRFNRALEDANAEWEQDQQSVLRDLGQKMMVVIDKYAKDHGFSVILDVSNPNTPVLYASNTVDITKDIIDLYDKNSATTSSTPSAKPAATDPASSNASPAQPGSAAPAATNPAPTKPAPSTTQPSTPATPTKK